jgi:hypothetical protein
MSKESSSRLSAADPEFLRLAVCYLEGGLGAEGVEKLQAMLRADQAKREAFVQLCLTGSALIEAMSESAAGEMHPGGDRTKLDDQRGSSQSNDLNESTVLPAITGEDESDEAVVVLPPAPVATRQEPATGILQRRWFWAASIVIPLLAGFAVYRLTSRSQSVATVTPKVLEPVRVPSFATVASTVNAQWSGATDQLLAGQRLPAIPLFLQSGFAQIKFDSGATVIVEAPARFQVEAVNSLELASGQICAKVPPSAHGFAVETATSRVVDLGTEFGVATSPDGSDEIQVFKGKVQAQPQAPGSVAPLLLKEGQAAVSTGQQIKLDPAGAQPQKFVRELGGAPGGLDLVDLIAGGDGTTHRRGVAIDYQKHAVGVFDPAFIVSGDYQYHRVSGSLVVDGCFIPDGSKGPVEVNSIGQTHVFPSTVNHVYDQIWTGGPIPGSPSKKYGPIPTSLGGIDYSGADHSILFMSSNGGLTIDLAAIQRLHPAYLLKRLQCVAGNGASGTTLADVYVLLGDKVVFEQHKFQSSHAPFTVDVPLDPADRFLTLVVTDGGDGIDRDGILWTDAKLIGDAR